MDGLRDSPTSSPPEYLSDCLRRDQPMDLDRIDTNLLSETKDRVGVLEVGDEDGRYKWWRPHGKRSSRIRVQSILADVGNAGDETEGLCTGLNGYREIVSSPNATYLHSDSHKWEHNGADLRFADGLLDADLTDARCDPRTLLSSTVRCEGGLVLVVRR